MEKDQCKKMAQESSVGTHTRTRIGTAKTITRAARVVLLHSPQHTSLVHSTMQHIHKDRDVLLASLLYCCGFIKQTPPFFRVEPPKIAKRSHLEAFHSKDYLDLLEPAPPVRGTSMECFDWECPGGNQRVHSEETLGGSSSAYTDLLDAYGLTDDCFLPTNAQQKARLWKYCRSVVGASLHGANLLCATDDSGSSTANANDSNVQVVIHWSGGRHHAHQDRAAGFCYVNDAVLAIQKLIQTNYACNDEYSNSHSQKNNQRSYNDQNCSTKRRTKRRVMYLDIDIHHADGVQAAFYDTDQVLTVSLHRHAPGFFPPKSGSIHEKGQHGTSGVGYNLNVPLPRGCQDGEFLSMVDRILDRVVPEYDPDVIVLCVGADGLRGDDLVKETCEGWNLSPECLAECTRRVASVCGGIECRSGDKQTNTSKKERKLLVLGGGGYNPVNTARTFLLCTAAACEASRPGMLWNELPNDVPRHEYFDRYGPSFELKQKHMKTDSGSSFYDPPPMDGSACNEYRQTILKSQKAVDLAHLFLSKQNKGRLNHSTEGADHEFIFHDATNEDSIWGLNGGDKAALMSTRENLIEKKEDSSETKRRPYRKATRSRRKRKI